MALTPVDFAATVTAVTLAASRLLPITQPFWLKLPQWARVGLPIFVMNLPQLAAAFGGARSMMDVGQAVLISLAMLLPGLSTPTSPHSKKQ